MFKVCLFSKPKMLAVGLTWKMCFPVRMLLGMDREGLEAHLPEGLLFCCLSPNIEGYRDWAALPVVSYFPRRAALEELGMRPESSWYFYHWGSWDLICANHLIPAICKL